MRQLAAIMFSDLVGFTAQMQEDEEGARELVRRHRDTLQRGVEEYGGRTLQFYGDGALTVFPSAVNAVDAAIGIQAELAAAPTAKLRIGLHMGDVVQDEFGVYGDGVNVAARVQSLGVPGSVLLSSRVQEELKNHPRIRTRALGAYQLKNVKRPLEILAVLGEGLTVPGAKDLPAPSASGPRSIAVLPFLNMSSDPENEFFSDGITEDVINALTRLEGLKVTARTSSFAFKGKNEDVRRIGEELAVETVLEGSVRRSGSRVRVAAQLIETRTGYHLFSNVYDRSLDDVFRVQDDVSRAIVEEMQLHLTRSGRSLGLRSSSSDAPKGEAYTEYLRGRHHFSRWTPEGAQRSIRHFDAAEALEPKWGAPLAMKAGAWVFLGAIGYVPAKKAYLNAEAAAREAIALDSSLGDAHAMLGLTQLFYHWDYDAAYASFQRALMLNPGSAQVHQLYAFHQRAIGALEESIIELETAQELDPLSLPTMAELAGAYQVAGRTEEAVEVCREGLRMEPAFRTLWQTLGFIHLDRGEIDKAIEAFEEIPRLKGDQYAAAGQRGLAYALAGREADARSMLDLLAQREEAEPALVLDLDFALVHLGLGEDEEAISRLEASADARHAAAIYLGLWPEWNRLHGHPRFERLIERIQGGASDP